MCDTPGQFRRCDFVVVPVAIGPASGSPEEARWICRERWHSGETDVMTEHVLGQPLQAIASPMAELTVFEEMVLALVHPLVQAYTLSLIHISEPTRRYAIWEAV